MLLTCVLWALAAIFLFRNYARDKGQHTAAKVVHAAVIGLVIWMHAYSLDQARWLGDFILRHDPSDFVFVGGVPGWLRVAVTEVLHLLLLLAAFVMVLRARWAVLTFRVVLMICVPVKLVFYYENFPEASSTPPSWTAMALGMLAIALFFGGIAMLYGMRFMRAFICSPTGVVAQNGSGKEQAEVDGAGG